MTRRKHKPFLFRRLREFAQEHWKEVLPDLDESKLFFVPDVAHATKSYACDLSLWAWASTHFSLPFPTTAVEDLGSCVIMSDLGKAHGLDEPRGFVDCISLDDRRAYTFSEPDPHGDAVLEHMRDTYRLTVDEARDTCRVNVGVITKFCVVVRNDGDLEVLSSTCDLESVEFAHRAIDGRLVDTFLFNPKIGRVDLTRRFPSRMVQNDDGTFSEISYRDVAREETLAALGNVVAAMEELLAINLPGNFVVEKRPLPPKSKKRKRETVDEGTRYLLLSTEEIRVLYGLPQLDAAGRRRATSRIRHWRSYPDDRERWPNVHGKSILIPAWCAPDMEGPRIVGNAEYSVRWEV